MNRISLKSLEHDLDPFPLYKEMRRERPVYFDPERRNWNIFRYENVKVTLSNYEVFSSEFMNGQEADAGMPFSASMISSDPPRHRKLRSLVTQAFTPKAVENLAPRIDAIVGEYIEQIRPDQPTELIHQLAYPLPVIVIAEMLGIPAQDRQRFKTWSDLVVQMADLEGNIDQRAFTHTAILEMSQYFLQMIEQRRQEPGDDLISGLLAAEVDGEKLDMIELIGFCALLLVAGNETTTNLISSAVLTFSQSPELWSRLRAQPELLPGAIEEVLRYRSPVQSMFRVTKAETSVADQVIPAGAPIVAWIGSANHDEQVFEEPDRFELARTPNRHMAFGQGIHYCLGAPLARLEARIALSRLLESFESVQIAPDARLERMPSMLIYGLKELKVVFTPA